MKRPLQLDRNYKIILVLLIVYLLFTNCNKDNTQIEKPQNTYKIGVILPLSGPDKSEWTNVTSWAIENITASGFVAHGNIELVWFDSYANEIEAIAQQICIDTTIVAAIGPFTSSESFIAAPYFIDAKKPLILPTATSADISSAFSGKKYIWRLSESDISQCQTLLIIAKNKGAKKVALLTNDDPYGMTFYNWFGFLATEMNLEVTYLKKYHQETENSNELLLNAIQSTPDIVVAIPGNSQEGVSWVNTWRNSGSQVQLLFSEIVYMDGFINSLGPLAEGIEGSTISNNPATGFGIAYEQRFYKMPTLGMAQIYDAILLLAYALEISGGEKGFQLASALMELSDGNGAPTFWDKDGILRTMNRLKIGERPQIMGASGRLKFASDFYTDILSSTYLHWQIYNQQFLNLSHYSSDGNGRISRLAAAWQSYANITQGFDTTYQANLAERNGLWALVIATSQGWSNYRHQADALRIYHFLKSKGLTDDHIIFCMADDIAYNSRNPLKGVVKDAISNENLYTGFELDYKIQDLNATAILDIIEGNVTQKTPIVLNTNQHTDVLLYFIGHGDANGMIITGENTSYITPYNLKNRLLNMSVSGKYRQILICNEACYSGVFQDCEGVPSVLLITAANRFESSKPVFFDSEIEAWLSNQFTNEWLKLVKSNPSITFSELYLQLCKTVYGSHSCIFNSQNFGNVYYKSINEFVIP